MHLIVALILSSLCTAVFAEQPTAISPAPPPPPMDASEADTDLEQQITITKQADIIIEEYRVGGKLYMIKIIPKAGPPYYLVDDRGDGKFSRQESLDSGVRPPRWIIHSF